MRIKNKKRCYALILKIALIISQNIAPNAFIVDSI